MCFTFDRRVFTVRLQFRLTICIVFDFLNTAPIVENAKCVKCAMAEWLTNSVLYRGFGQNNILPSRFVEGETRERSYFRCSVLSCSECRFYLPACGADAASFPQTQYYTCAASTCSAPSRLPGGGGLPTPTAAHSWPTVEI